MLTISVCHKLAEPTEVGRWMVKKLAAHIETIFPESDRVHVVYKHPCERLYVPIEGDFISTVPHLIRVEDVVHTYTGMSNVYTFSISFSPTEPNQVNEWAILADCRKAFAASGVVVEIITREVDGTITFTVQPTGSDTLEVVELLRGFMEGNAMRELLLSDIAIEDVAIGFNFR